MEIKSSAFDAGGDIPSRYTCDGDNVNPELAIEDVPGEAKSLVLLMDDPDIPESVKSGMGIEKFDHWTLINIPEDTSTIPENSVPESATVGKNSSGGSVYTGPCPPARAEHAGGPDGRHRYFFKLYALDTVLPLDSSATQSDVVQAMEGHVLESATLMGYYQRT